MTDNKQKVHFEKKKNRYNERLLIQPPKHVVEETQRILNILESNTITKVVDFGSGNGRLTIPLLKEKMEVTAVDISKQSLLSLLNLAIKIGVKRNLLTLSSKIPEKKWDAVVGCDILHHVPLSPTLSEIRDRLADKKGILIFSEPNIVNPSWIIFVTLFLSWKIERGMVNCSYFNFLRELKKNNFNNITLHGHGLFPPILLNGSPFLQKINYFLGNLPLIKFFAYRYIILAYAN